MLPTRIARLFISSFVGMARRQFRAFATNRSGNLAIAFALLTVPITLAVGCGFDYVRSVNTQRRMQSALDSALVASIKNIGTKDTDALKVQIGNWMEAQAVQKNYYVLSNIVIDKSNATVRASVAATLPTTFLKIAGIQNMKVAISSAVVGGPDTVSKNAFSMYLVLDRSGSMGDPTNTSYTTTCYSIPLLKWGAYTCTKKYLKIEALKLAVGSLMTQLATADPDSKYVRTGSVSYNQAMQTPSPLAWGETASLDYVNALTANGNTDSSDAIALAYSSLTANETENKIHLAKNGTAKPDKFIVLMTDGENNQPSADSDTKITCDKARAQGVQVFAIAFMAPQAGQDLLRYCATGSANYFAAEDTADLVAAFKLIGETSSKTILRLTQ